MADLGESYPVRTLFYLDRDEDLSPFFDRSKGFSHLAWVDLSERLGGDTWAPSTLVFLLGSLGVLLAIRGLDPDLP